MPSILYESVDDLISQQSSDGESSNVRAFKWTDLNEEDIVKLKTYLQQNPQVQSLEISIDEQEKNSQKMSLLAKILGHNELPIKKLSFKKDILNGMGAQNIQHLAEGLLTNTTLRSLDLCTDVPPASSEGKMLFEALENNASMTGLQLDFRCKSPADYKELANFMTKSIVLKSLNVFCYHQDLNLFFAGLKKNTSLKRLFLSIQDGMLEKSDAKKLIKALSSNPKLINLQIICNQTSKDALAVINAYNLGHPERNIIFNELPSGETIWVDFDGEEALQASSEMDQPAPTKFHISHLSFWDTATSTEVTICSSEKINGTLTRLNLKGVSLSIDDLVLDPTSTWGRYQRLLAQKIANDPKYSLQTSPTRDWYRKLITEDDDGNSTVSLSKVKAHFLEALTEAVKHFDMSTVLGVFEEIKQSSYINRQENKNWDTYLLSFFKSPVPENEWRTATFQKADVFPLRRFAKERALLQYIRWSQSALALFLAARFEMKDVTLMIHQFEC